MSYLFDHFPSKTTGGWFTSSLSWYDQVYPQINMSYPHYAIIPPPIFLGERPVPSRSAARSLSHDEASTPDVLAKAEACRARLDGCRGIPLPFI